MVLWFCSWIGKISPLISIALRQDPNLVPDSFPAPFIYTLLHRRMQLELLKQSLSAQKEAIYIVTPVFLERIKCKKSRSQWKLLILLRHLTYGRLHVVSFIQVLSLEPPFWPFALLFTVYSGDSRGLKTCHLPVMLQRTPGEWLTLHAGDLPGRNWERVTQRSDQKSWGLLRITSSKPVSPRLACRHGKAHPRPPHGNTHLQKDTKQIRSR